MGWWVTGCRNTLPAKDLGGLIAWLKANPDKASQGTAGAGSPQHIAGIYFQKETATRFQFVPYRGVAPAMQDLVAGQLDFMIDQATNSLPQVSAGKIRAYAVTGLGVGLPRLDLGRWHRGSARGRPFFSESEFSPYRLSRCSHRWPGQCCIAGLAASAAVLLPDRPPTAHRLFSHRPQPDGRLFSRSAPSDLLQVPCSPVGQLGYREVLRLLAITRDRMDFSPVGALRSLPAGRLAPRKARHASSQWRRPFPTCPGAFQSQCGGWREHAGAVWA
jgi:Tripartite tricarboxylate transporter family receptor